MASPHYYSYGTEEHMLEAQDETLAFSKHGKARKGFLGYSLTDFVCMALSLFVPLMIFAAVYSLMSFYWHYKYNFLDWVLILLIFGIVVFLGRTTTKRMLQQADGATDHFAVWAATLFVGVVLAFVFAVSFGLRNYANYMGSYYEMKELNSYTDVDASTMAGKSFMDSGVISFKPGSTLDLSKATAFMNLDMYCVAPVVSNSTSESYDFWAVGINCCTGAPNSFACGQPDPKKNDRAKHGFPPGGLRLLSESQLPFFRMAVTQAATRYGLKSEHPIFLHFVGDASKTLSDRKKAGWESYMRSVFAFGLLQAIIVLSGAAGVLMVKSKYI